MNARSKTRGLIRHGAIFWLGIILSGFLVACPNLFDTTAPNITITSPTNNATVNTTTATVNGAATDDTGISNLEYTLNGGATQSIVVTNPFSFTETNLIVGNNTIAITARDAAGNKQTAVLNLRRVQAANQFALNISKSGTGTGSVVSNPAGIDCGATCSANFSSGTSVTLTATPATGSSFAGWSGACTGTNTCVVTMSTATNVTANFENTSIIKINEVEPNDTANQAQKVAFNSKITGSISSNSDADYYKFNVTAGDWIKFDLDAQSLNPVSPLDSVLEVLDSKGTSLVQNNNTRNWSIGSVDSFIAYKFSSTGEHTLKVSSVSSLSQGVYTLTIQNKAPAWTLRTVGGNYREVNSTTRLDTSRISLELRDADDPDYGPTGTYPLVITGPNGWNNNQAFTTDTQWFGDYRDLNPPPAPGLVILSNPQVANLKSNLSPVRIAPLMAGAYTAKLSIYGSEYTSSFNIDSGTALAVPEPVTLSNISLSSVTATWSAVSGAVRYFTVLLDTSNNSWVASKSTANPEVAFAGLTLDKTKQYRIDVNAYRDNGIEQAFLNNISFDSSANRNTFFTPTSTPTTFALNITKTGTGTGSISSNPSGIACGATCSAAFNSGTSVALTATPAAGSRFAGWSGVCTGTTTCTVTMDAAKSVTATFNTNPVSSFDLATAYPQNSSTYTIAPNANALYFVNIANRNNFTVQAQNFDALEFTGSILGTGTNQVQVVFRKDLSSADALAFVLVGGSSVPIGEYTVSVVARGGGITSSTTTVKILVTPCSSGC